MGFLGTYANLTNYRIGNFTVDGLAGRDNAGAPRWRLTCSECSYCQVIPHVRAANLLESKSKAVNLYCANAACRLSKSQANHSETLSELLNRERRQAEEVVRAAAETQKAAEIEAAKQRATQRATQQRIEGLRASYYRYKRHGFDHGWNLDTMLSFAIWCKISDDKRAGFLERQASGFYEKRAEAIKRGEILNE